MQQSDVFRKLLENMHGNVYDVDHFSKVSVFQNGLSHGRLSISFPNTFLWLPPNVEQKRIPLNDNIVWCKHFKIINDLSVVAFSYEVSLIT